MLSLDYLITKEDYRNYFTYVLWDGPQNQKKRIQYYLWQLWPIPLLVFAFYKTGFLGRDTLFITATAAIFITLVLFVFLGARSNMSKRADAIVNDPNNQSIFLPGVLSIAETGIVLKNENMEAKYQWKAFIRKQENEQYYFLFINSLQALIVPKRIFLTTESKLQFEKFLKQYLSFEAELGHLVKS